MGSRNYVFTINNYTAGDAVLLEDSPYRYLIYGYEVGENGTPHLQGYIELNKTMRITGLRKWFPRAHFEARRGTREQARDYCKKDGEFLELGDWNKGGQGARNDLAALMEIVKVQPRLAAMEALPEVYARNVRFIEMYRAEVEKNETREFRHVEVNVLYGPAGCGKTRQVFEQHPNVFTVNAGEQFPFEGYNGEDTILLDDFYGGIKYHEILRILDGFQYRVNVKGSHRYAKWNKVFITSNKQPSEWYANGLTPALARRLTTVTKLGDDEAGNNDAALIAI